MLQVLAIGLISAGIYALFAVGIVLVYRGTKVLTFAGGEVGTAALYVAAFLVTDHGMPWVVGALAAVLIAAAAGLAFEAGLVRWSREADPVVTSILTVALSATIFATEFNLHGNNPTTLETPVRIGSGLDVDGVIVSPIQIAAIVVAALLGFGLQSFLRRTDFGLAILAAADDAPATLLVGVRVSRIRLVLWASSFGLAAVAALLVEPTVGFITPGYASTLYLGGLAAAVIGGLDSLPGAVVGATVLGLAQAFADKYFKGLGLSGLSYVVTLTLLLVVLLVRSYAPEIRKRLAAPVEVTA
ncbi:MAG: livH2 [Frankiales bacterium]|nr:livH2 [Frankiales bacterium]